MVAPFDPTKPLAGTNAEGYLRGPQLETQYLEKSGNQLLGELRDMGLKIRTQDFFDIRREQLGLHKYEEQVKGLKPDTRIPRAWINDDHGWDIKKNFLYRIEVTGLDPNTGDETSAFFSLGSDKEFPVGDMEANLISLLVDEEVPYDIIVQGALVYAGMARPGAMG